MDVKTSVAYSNSPIDRQNNSVDLFDDYAKLKQENEDYKLMLKALAGLWVCVYEEDFNCWSWSSFEDVIEGQYKKIKVKSTQSDIPEINDELREEFKKI